jgi:hypothetical protein
MPGRPTLAALAVALMGAGVAAQSAAPGPPRMPYVAVHEPVFVPASTATFAQDADLVIGVARSKVAKAYMAADLWQHGSVDTTPARVIVFMVVPKGTDIRADVTPADITR